MQFSRYDEHAAWFVSYSQDWTPTSSSHLPVTLEGARVLDLACGWGPLSRDLAERGAVVTGVELSEPLLEQARALETDRNHRIRYLRGDATTLAWWDEQPFDGVVCNMALMDIDDLDAATATIHEVLRPGGWFNVSLHHPCFPGAATPDGDALPSWSPEHGYGAEGWWTTESTGVRGHVGAQHRKLSTYLNSFLRVGLEFTGFVEPDPALPRILLIDGRRPLAR
jgi:SAM-dependent methyltransferase